MVPLATLEQILSHYQTSGDPPLMAGTIANFFKALFDVFTGSGAADLANEAAIAQSRFV